MTNLEDITIALEAEDRVSHVFKKVADNAERLVKKVNKFKASFKKISDASSDSLQRRKGWGFPLDKFKRSSADIEKLANAGNKDFMKGMDRTTKDMNKQLDKRWKDAKVINKKIDTIRKKSVSDTISRNAAMKKSLLGAGLSFLFTGMAIKKVMDGIRKASVDTFTKIMESAQQNGTAIQQLGAHWEYLKFTIGSALNTVLEALLPVLLPIIAAFVEWAGTHPRLIGQMIILGTILGTLMMTIGQTGLALLGFIELLKLMKLLGAWAAMKGGWLAVLKVFGLIVAVVVVIIVWIYKIVEEMKRLEVFESFIDSLKMTFSGLIKIFKGLWMIITGDFDEGWKYILAGFAELFLGIISATITFGMSFISYIYNIPIAFASIFAGMGTAAYEGLKGILAIAKAFGSNIYNVIFGGKSFSEANADMKSAWKSVGMNVVKGFVIGFDDNATGMRDSMDSMVKEVINIGDELKNNYKDTDLFKDTGGYANPFSTDTGMIDETKQSFLDLSTATDEVTQSMMTGWTKTDGTISKFFADMITKGMENKTMWENLGKTVGGKEGVISSFDGVNSTLSDMSENSLKSSNSKLATLKTTTNLAGVAAFYAAEGFAALNAEL